jgi:hypothetical protein
MFESTQILENQTFGRFAATLRPEGEGTTIVEKCLPVCSSFSLKKLCFTPSSLEQQDEDGLQGKIIIIIIIFVRLSAVLAIDLVFD